MRGRRRDGHGVPGDVPARHATYGSAGTGVLVYVMRGSAPPWTSAGCCDFTLQARDFYGTVVVEGNGQAGCGGASRDLAPRNRGDGSGPQPNVYGYPLAYLVFDPVEAVTDAPEPTANPLDPQETCAAHGQRAPGPRSTGSSTRAGTSSSTPSSWTGASWPSRSRPRATRRSYGYNPTYGQAAPPPGFPVGAGNTVVLVRKSFIVCVNYAADTGGGSSLPVGRPGPSGGSRKCSTTSRSLTARLRIMAAMPPPPSSTYKIGLVGTGIHLVHAIEALRAVPAVTIAIVADASDRSEGGKLAKSLQLQVVKNAMEVFKTEANIVLEVSGDERQYERLLSIKPPGVEVMSVRGARLLMDLLKKAEAAPGAGEGGALPPPAPPPTASTRSSP